MGVVASRPNQTGLMCQKLSEVGVRASARSEFEPQMHQSEKVQQDTSALPTELVYLSELFQILAGLVTSSKTKESK